MAAKFTSPDRSRAVAARPTPVGPGAQRKIGLIGTHARTLLYAPWNDPSWEFWSHASAWHSIPADRADVLFDLHGEVAFKYQEKKNGFTNYYKWLQRNRTPIYMQKRYPEIPASLRYPREEMQQQWPSLEFGSQVAYMIALALSRGVTHIGLWGVQYGNDTEYRLQRGNCQMWMGIAMGRGVQIVIPKTCGLLQDIGKDYAYDTHETVESMAAWREQCGMKPAKKTAPSSLPLSQRVTRMETADDYVRAAATRQEVDAEFAKIMAEHADEELTP